MNTSWEYQTKIMLSFWRKSANKSPKPTLFRNFLLNVSILTTLEALK